MGGVRLPLRIQVAFIAASFLAAVLVLIVSGRALVAREGRRASARTQLEQAGRALGERGVPELAEAPRWPNPPAAGWEALDEALGRVANDALARHEGVEGGYFLLDFRRFLGSAFPTERKPDGGAAPADRRRRPTGPPPREYDLIEGQADSAIRTRTVLFLVQDVPPSTVAVRSAPIVAEGRVVGATWVMIRLVDPLFLRDSLQGYQAAAGLALLGITLSLALTFGLVATVRRQADEGERLQAELLRSERLAALGKLVAGVAHEVRNPLAGIRSSVQLWRRGIGPDEASIADVEAEADRIEAIVSRLLQFSRESGQSLEPGDLDEVVSEVARLASPGADAQGVVIRLEPEGPLPPVLMSAPALIQLFRNLTSNALQAMPDGGELVLATRYDPRRGVVEADVADTGPGISPEVRAHLFDPFFTTRPEGTGLGLALAREIALAHHGDLRLVARPGERGARFRLALPTARRHRGGRGST